MRVLLPFGSNPPQNNIPQLHTINDMFLYAAWVHGMDSSAMIYRRTLFHYIQTHIAPKTQQGLQGPLNTSEYLTNEGKEKGQYCLTQKGQKKMLERFGPPHENLSRQWDYEFVVNVDSYQISIYSNYKSQHYVFKLDNQEYSAAEIIRRLKREGLYNSSKVAQDSILLFDFILAQKFNWHIVNFPTLTEINVDYIFKSESDENSFREGKEYYALHKERERDSSLVKLAKSIWRINDPLLRCQICGFSFKEQYGDLGDGYIEAHHMSPLSDLQAETETKVEDLLMVCSNCHKMLHTKRPWQTHVQLIGKLNKYWDR